jgi:ABC-type polysaccharide/polyol phosphate export permease
MNRIKKLFSSVFDFFYHIFLQRQVIATLSRRDFERKYIKNFFGMVWAIIDPFAFVMILYVVFGTRFGNRNEMGVPFAAYLLCGYIAFDIFNSSLQNLTMSVNDHSFLLRKINFRVAILPIVRMLSNLMVHAVVLVVCMIILLFNHIYPTLYWFQLLYYIFAVSVFLIATAWFTSSVFLFFPDISNVVSIIARVLFFITPIFWNLKGISGKALFILKLNPLFYFVNGYRDSLLYQHGFWQHPMLTLYFWLLCLVMIVIGITVFKKLRPHFSDVVA